MTVGEDMSAWLTVARQDIGMSQAQLGRQIDVAPNTIARWERGERLVQHPRMLRLALLALQAKKNRV